MDRLVVASLLAFIVTVHLMNGVFSNRRCQGNGFGGCGSNFLGGSAPTGLEIFSTGDGQHPNLAELCEGDTVAILYDCNKRIPLYAATVMTGDQFNVGGIQLPRPSFRNSPNLHPVDYQRKIHQNYTLCNKEKKANRGHLIAAGYGRGYPNKVKATFVYTNVVPQFSSFNSGTWRAFEEKLVKKWGGDQCAITNAMNVKMYIIVGSIPSTYPIPNELYNPSYCGSGFQINVPSVMWTAACCTFQRQDGSGKLVTETRHTAFWRNNDPTKEICKVDDSITSFFQTLKLHNTINLFPAAGSSCSDSKNYRRIA